MSPELKTGDIRQGYAWTPRERPAEYTRSRMSDFDHWLESHDREVAAKAWDEGYDAGLGDGYDPGLGYGPVVSAKNPYKNGETL